LRLSMRALSPRRVNARPARALQRLGPGRLQELPGPGRALGAGRPGGRRCAAAGRGAGAAQRQGGWTKLHRAMLAYEGDFTTESLLALGTSVGLDSAKLKTDMMVPATDKALQADLTLAAALGVDVTPTFVIGERVIRGALSPEAFQALVEEEAGKR